MKVSLLDRATEDGPFSHSITCYPVNPEMFQTGAFWALLCWKHQAMCVCCFTNERPSVFLYKLVQSKVSKLKSRYMSHCFSCMTSFPCTYRVVCLTLTQRMLMSKQLHSNGEEKDIFSWLLYILPSFWGTSPNLCLTFVCSPLHDFCLTLSRIGSGKCIKWMEILENA